MRSSDLRRLGGAAITLLVSAKVLTWVACGNSTVDSPADDGGVIVDPNADLSDTGSGGDGGAGAGDMATRSGDMAGGSGTSDMATGGPPEGSGLLSGITAEHNKARAAVTPVPATALPAMTWSTAIAASAQAWADGCKYMHNPNTPYGENIFATTASTTAAAVVGSWVSEKANYNYAANTCSSTCGHYTQVVWRSSIRLGCGVKNCTTGSPFGSGNWQFWVCSYDPPGNSGQRPY